MVGGATGTAYLLVVRDWRARRTQVHDETEVRFVETHAQGTGRH